jgi:hypothetical protein
LVGLDFSSCKRQQEVIRALCVSSCTVVSYVVARLLGGGNQTPGAASLSSIPHGEDRSPLRPLGFSTTVLSGIPHGRPQPALSLGPTAHTIPAWAAGHGWYGTAPSALRKERKMGTKPSEPVVKCGVVFTHLHADSDRHGRGSMPWRARGLSLIFHTRISPHHVIPHGRSDSAVSSWMPVQDAGIGECMVAGLS